MKTMFIIGKSDSKIEINDLGRLGDRVGVVTTAQHLHKTDSVKVLLESKGKEVLIGGQLLGCNAANAVKIKDSVDCFLYVGDGRFHPIEVYLKTKKPVFVIVNGKVVEFDKKGLDSYEKHVKVGLVKYHSSSKIGILVSVKEHQQKLKQAEELKKKLEDQGKEAYLFVFDHLDFGQLENFPFVEMWVNTACPRLIDDYDKFNKPVINIDEIR